LYFERCQRNKKRSQQILPKMKKVERKENDKRRSKRLKKGEEPEVTRCKSPILKHLNELLTTFWSLN